MTKLGWSLAATLVVSGCECDPKPAPAAAISPPRAIPGARTADAAPRASVRPTDTRRLGELLDADALTLLAITGEHVYWGERVAVEPIEVAVRRAPLAGGAVQELYRGPQNNDPFPLSVAEVDGTAYFAGLGSSVSTSIRSKSNSIIVRLERGRAVRVASSQDGVAASDLFAIGRRLFWVAATPIGPGPVLAYDLDRRKLATVVACSNGDCPELLPGTPPVVHDGRLSTLGVAGLSPVAAQCPAGFIANGAFGPYVTCTTFGPAAHLSSDDSDSLFVPLAGGKPIEAPDLGGLVGVEGGFYYHVTRSGLMRRRELDAADEPILTGELGEVTVGGGHVTWRKGRELFIGKLP